MPSALPRPITQPNAAQTNRLFLEAMLAPRLVRDVPAVPVRAPAASAIDTSRRGHRPAGRPQLGAAGTRVGPHFLVAGLNRLFRQHFPKTLVAKRILDSSVFQ